MTDHTEEAWTMLKRKYEQKGRAYTEHKFDPDNFMLQEQYLKRLHIFIGAVTMFCTMTGTKSHYVSNLLREGAAVFRGYAGSV